MTAPGRLGHVTILTQATPVPVGNRIMSAVLPQVEGFGLRKSGRKIHGLLKNGSKSFETGNWLPDVALLALTLGELNALGVGLFIGKIVIVVLMW